MSSFTSAFKCDEAKVALAVLAMLAGLEVFFRLAGGRLSEDVVSTRAIASTAGELAAASPPRTLIVGNSMAREGVDPDLLAKEITAGGDDSAHSFFLVYPDSSHALVWEYLLRKQFIGSGIVPENVILVAGRQHLFDAPGNNSQMGAYFVSWRDSLRFIREETGSVDEAAEFLLGRMSDAYSMRARVSPRVFDFLLPHYQENWVILNRAALAGRGTALAGADAGGATRHLRGIAELLREKNCRLIVALAPLPYAYELHPGLAADLRELSIPVVNVNPLPGIGPDCFSDADHLNEKGRGLFTKALAKELPGALKVNRGRLFKSERESD